MSAVVPPALAPHDAGWTERAYQRLLSAALGALGFFVLFSTAGTAVTLLVLLLLAVAAPARFWRAVPWREPVVVSSLLLLAYIALRSVGESGLTLSALKTVNRYHELLLVPLLYGLMRLTRRPQWFINGLLLAVVSLAIITWLQPVYSSAAEFMDRRRISVGFGCAVCAYLVFEHTRRGHLSRSIGYLLAAFLAITVIFAGEGRTGQLVLLFLVACASWGALDGRFKLPLTIAVLVAAIGVASLSPPVRDRIAETWSGVQAAENGQVERTSTGARLEILRNSLVVTREYWLTGTGWQHYPGALAAASARRHQNPEEVFGALIGNPHDEYLLQLGAGGVPALLLFVLWLACPIWMGWREARERPWAAAVAAVAASFALASVFNSLLLDWVEGHFYVALLAWLLARRVRD